MLMTQPVIRQRLFSATTPDGIKLYLAFLLDGSCAILRDDEVIEIWTDCDSSSLDRALDRFLALAKLGHD